MMKLYSYGGQSADFTRNARLDAVRPAEEVWDAESYRRYIEAQAALVCAAVKGDVSEDIRRIGRAEAYTGGIRRGLRRRQGGRSPAMNEVRLARRAPWLNSLNLSIGIRTC